MPITLRPIGHVHHSRPTPTDDHWDQETCTIELIDPYTPASLLGLDTFSHAEILFLFHQVDESKLERHARHPRNNPAYPLTGIFAQRAKDRPNRLATSIARILKVDGTTLTLAGLDAITGTPVLDIKPVMAEFLPRGELRQPQWSHDLMQHYWE